jgi:Proteasome subunit
VTIIAVTFVPDGIVMAADSRLTTIKQHKDGKIEKYVFSDNQDKVFLLNNNIGLCFLGTGFRDGMKVTSVIEELNKTIIKEKISIVETSEKAHELLKTQYSNLEVQFCLAGYFKDEQHIYVVNKHFSHKINDHNSFGRYVDGDEDISTKIRSFLDGGQFNLQLMPLKDAIVFTEFIIQTAINYQNFEDKLASCGGPVDILVITKDYAKFYKHKILT